MQHTHLLLHLLLLLFAAHAALPPGFEDEHYCPTGYSCLRRKVTPPGWAGDFNQFYECCDEATGNVTRVRCWGTKLEIEQKTQLLKGGYQEMTNKFCAHAGPLCGTGLYIEHAHSSPVQPPSAHAIRMRAAV